MTHSVESILSLARALGRANGIGEGIEQAEYELRAALTEALAQRETSDFQKWSVLAFRALDDACLLYTSDAADE